VASLLLSDRLLQRWRVTFYLQHHTTKMDIVTSSYLVLATLALVALALVVPKSLHFLLFLVAVSGHVFRAAVKSRVVSAPLVVQRLGKVEPSAPVLLGHGKAKQCPSSSSSQGAKVCSADSKVHSYEDPLRWSLLPSKGINRAHEVHMQDTDTATVKIFIMARPTHDKDCDISGAYPSSWHFQGCSRKWEARIQLRFKQLPKNPLFVGLEMEGYKRMPLLVRRAESALVATATKLLGPVYRSHGDDPSKADGAEVEPPCVSVPLYACDRMIVSDVGEEPDITSSLQGLGALRAGGFTAFREHVNATLDDVSTDKVYTFCIWSVSNRGDRTSARPPDGLKQVLLQCTSSLRTRGLMAAVRHGTCFP